MSRSDGRMPAYIPLDIDKDLWPANYWDNSRRCTGENCGLKWPDTHLFTTSPCCKSNTIREEGPPDIRWPEAVSRLLHLRFERFYEEWNEGRSDEELAWEDVKTGGEYDHNKASKEVDRFIEDASRQPQT